MKQLNDKDIASISVLTIDSRRPETIGLIKKHGISLPANAPTQLVDKAFISLAKQNAKFREDFSALAHDTSVSFTGSNEGNFFTNFTGKNEGNWFNSNGVQPSASQLAQQAGASAAVKDLTSTATTPKTSGWKDYFSNLFTPDFTRDILNTGLNVWSNKQIGQNAPTTQNTLDEARYELQDKTDTTKSQGMGVGSIILISVVALALIGGVIYFVRKK
jgi:cobalamin biosynthesis Mg chelatase CobN